MSIAEIVEQKAIKAYIDTNGNQTQAYLSSHPNTTNSTAYGNASNFIEKHGIAQKAIAVLEGNEKLNAKSILNSLTNEIEATRATYTRAGKNLDPDYAVRLNAKKFILTDVYGIGKEDNITLNDNRTMSITLTDMTSVAKELKTLTTQSKSFMEKLNNSDEI